MVTLKGYNSIKGGVLHAQVYDTRNLYKTCSDAHDHYSAVWLVGCVLKVLVPETCTKCSCVLFGTSFWYQILECVSPLTEGGAILQGYNSVYKNVLRYSTFLSCMVSCPIASCSCISSCSAHKRCVAGDMFVKVRDRDEQGWCAGCINGRIGLYPDNYVEIISR